MKNKIQIRNRAVIPNFRYIGTLSPSRRASRSVLAVSAALAALSALPHAQAQFTWNGTSNAYNTGSSWVGGVAPSTTNSSTTETVTFSNIGNATFNSPNITSSRSMLSLTFTADAFAYTFGTTNGSGLTIRAAGGLSNNSNATQTFNVAIQNNGGNLIVTNTLAGGSLIFNGAMNLANTSANRILNLNGLGTITVAGAINNGSSAPASAVTIASTGATTLSGNNTYDGTTTMNAVGGVLSLNGDNSGADGAVTITAGTVKLGHSNALGSTGNGTSVASDAVLDLNGQSVGAEAVTLNGTGISSGGALVNTSGTSASLSGAVTLATNTSIGGTGNITLGNIGESGGARTLTKVGTGTLSLSGTKSYTGLTTINGGTLDITGGNSAAGSFTLSGAGTVLRASNLNALATTASVTGSASGATTGTVDLAVAGAYQLGTYTQGNLIFSASSGNATTLTFNNNSAITTGGSSTRTLSNSAANLNIVFAGDLDIGGTVAGGATVASAGNTTVNGAITVIGGSVTARTLTKSGSGILTLKGTNSYEGATNINGGTLILSSTGSTHASSAVTVATNAALGGDGTVGGSATFNDSSIFAWGLNVTTPSSTASATVADTFAVTGNLTDGGTGGGSVFKIILGGTQTFADTFWTANQSWNNVLTSGNSLDLSTLFTSFSYVNSAGTIAGPTGGGFFSLSGSTLSFTAVPEPTSALAGILLSAGLLRRRRNVGC